MQEEGCGETKKTPIGCFFGITSSSWLPFKIHDSNLGRLVNRGSSVVEDRERGEETTGGGGLWEV